MVQVTSLFILATSVLIGVFAAPTAEKSSTTSDVILGHIQDVQKGLGELRVLLDDFPSDDGIKIDDVCSCSCSCFFLLA